ncbi:hypothetical protein G9A89_016431 [Geosiphon pyriformis]|nr:hypothetical protein G9A89_016431 [Geosiphon pyriformis]
MAYTQIAKIKKFTSKENNAQDTVTNAKDFELAELKANHAQVINLVINKSSELNSKLKQFSNSINQKLEEYLADNCTIYQLPQQRNIQENANCFQNQLRLSSLTNQQWQQKIHVCHYCGKQEHLRIDYTQPNNLETNQHPKLISNILPATITENKSLDAIFPFELKELSTMPLFSRAVLKEKPITAIYTNAKVDGHPIKLILNSGSAGSIITKQLMDQLGHRVDHTASARIITADGAIKTPIVENNWLSKTNAILDWTMQKLQLSQNGQHTCVLTTCGHFKTPNSTTPLIKFEEKEKKPTWKAYQVSCADIKHNELLPVPSWNDNSKGKQREKLT